MHKKWLTKDIILLRKYYLERKSLDEIAALLGRTRTSVNKCLTRFNIRPMSRSGFFKLKKIPLQTSTETQVLSQEAIKKQVLMYAQHVIGHTITPIDKQYYQVGFHPKTFRQILVMVNSHRLRHGLEGFSLQ